ncbi:MAG: MGMT family protein [Micrococcales bacterium]|nr:MGMT family protein [Micrococcales bacterium]
MPKTANEKLAYRGNLPKVEEITDPAAQTRLGGRSMLVAPAADYDELMKQVPNGRVITQDRLRQILAKRYNAETTCPTTCGIFTRVAAEAHEERGGVDPTPWWRTLKRSGELNPKYPGGLERQKALLEAEGHQIVERGKRWFVGNYRAVVWQPST